MFQDSIFEILLLDVRVLSVKCLSKIGNFYANWFFECTLGLPSF